MTPDELLVVTPAGYDLDDISEARSSDVRRDTYFNASDPCFLRLPYDGLCNALMEIKCHEIVDARVLTRFSLSEMLIYL